jgi:hypothetical protein
MRLPFYPDPAAAASSLRVEAAFLQNSKFRCATIQADKNLRKYRHDGLGNVFQFWKVDGDHDQFVPATILVSSERVAPGRIIQHSPFAKLAISSVGEQRLRGVVTRLDSVGFSVQFTSDEKSMLWRKLAFWRRLP